MATITQKTQADTQEELLHILNPSVRRWFLEKFGTFSLPQLYGIKEIHSRRNILVSAPTGATKTLTGFLAILNELVDSAQKGLLEDKVYCVYISPLKALSYDIQVNLLEPLAEIEKIAHEKLGIRVAVRTGDTTQAEKAGMLKNPPHILITTPESLAILLASKKFCDKLKDVQWCILDELHALADNKRGVHLSITIERLAELSGHMARIGLSATVSPLEEMAQYLTGGHEDCIIVDVQFIKDIDIKVLSPLDNLIDSNYTKLQAALYQMIDDLITEHKTTLIFTNTRSATERVVHHLRDLFPKKYGENIGAHHGSLSKEHRQKLEQDLRDGKMKCVVCSTSLELGIDIGHIDLVILLSSPKSVARCLQRIGRAGHKLHARAKGRIIVLDRDDLVECSVLLKASIEKKIDRIHIPRNCLDVLAQQIYGISVSGPIHIQELYTLIRKSYCYSDLARKDFLDTIAYLSGEYVSLEERHIYAKIWYDKETGIVNRRGKLARMLFMTNVGTIPDEAAVVIKEGPCTLGTIDEAFLEKLRPGDVFVLAGSVYKFKYSRGMVAQVTSSVERPPNVPRWFSEMLPLSFDLACQIGAFRNLMEDRFKDKQKKEEIISFIHDYLYVDDKAANAIYEYFSEQYSLIGLPTGKKLIIEVYNDGKQCYYVFHSMYGRRVNDVLSRAIAFAVSRLQHRDVEMGLSDNGFYVTSDKKIQVPSAFKMLRSERLEELMNAAIDSSEVFKRRFRHCATRALMILRNYRGRTKTAGRQQVSSQILINAARRIDNDFPILKETRREVLEDLMDIGNAKKVLRMIEDSQLKVVEIGTDIPSPFAFNLIAQGYTDLLRADDKMAFLSRMHEMVLAKISLGERMPKKEIQDKVSQLKGDFSYDRIWGEQEARKEQRMMDEKETLLDDFNRAARRVNLDPQITYDIKNLIEGDTKGFRDETISWIGELISGTVPRVWNDRLIRFLKQKYESIRYNN